MLDLHEEARDGAEEESARPAGPAAVVPPWDSELLVLRGSDRAHLLQRLERLETFLRANGAVDLKDLAYSLSTEAAPVVGACLALVAGSREELQARAASAAKRLADPKRTQIRDAAGIYYFDRPLQKEGSLALLFPGEGGEYVNMLSDLCPHFPEVAEAFDKAEKLAWKASRAAGERFARLFRLPRNASAEERARAEKDLVQLDAIASGVLLADWAMFALLEELGVEPAAVAGHSLGEIAALQACGAIEGSEEQLSHVGDVLNQLVAWEAEKAITPSKLLAVGAGRAVVEEVVQATVGEGIHLAMDNCPHQVIAVGHRDLVGTVEAELKRRQVICEYLPFDVPYHTPLFEPYLGPFTALFEKIPFRRQPLATLYSFSTASPFPSDAAAMRRHVVENFARPVEFTALVRVMHADGVRIFVECGPRGNLASFVDDILRKERFVAVASNLPTRSGVTQLNHLAGLLAAHHVPLRLEHLYARRSPRRIAWEESPKPAAPEEPAAAAEGGPRAAPPMAPPAPVAAGHPGRAGVMSRHLALMEQFLDDQAELMAAYLDRRRRSGRTVPVPAPEAAPPPAPFAEARPSLADLPLLSTASILAFEAGREITVQRPLDLAEDLFALHHTIGGHAVSKVDPNQHGLPVMPMTFSLEVMAELAACLCPGYKAIGIENVRLFHWLAFDADELASIEAAARLLPAAGPASGPEVAVTIHVLGGAANKAGGRSPAGQGVVRLARDYPEPPPVEEFPLTDEHPCRIPVDVLYRNLFHGPLFQGTRSTGRSGLEGLEGEIEVLPRERLFRSQPDPHFALDPVTLDVGMHPISAWQLEFPDQAGRVLLPVELKKIEIFGPQLAPGSRLASRCFARGGSYRHFNHCVDLIGPDGRHWSRMSGLTFWRFYVPFAEVNFFGPKDEYFISKPWDAVLARSSVPARCIRLDTPPDQKQRTMRIVTSKVALAPPEMAEYRGLGGDEEQEISWLFGRLAAKDSVRLLWHARHGERLYPTDIVITSPNGRGLAARPRGTAAEAFPNVAIARLDDVVASVAAFEAPVGIALARCAPREEPAWNAGERALLAGLGERSEWTARFLAAKEAARQALGGVDPPTDPLVLAADARTGTLALACGAARGRVLAHTARDGDLVVAVCLNERAA